MENGASRFDVISLQKKEREREASLCREKETKTVAMMTPLHQPQHIPSGGISKKEKRLQLMNRWKINWRLSPALTPSKLANMKQFGRHRPFSPIDFNSSYVTVTIHPTTIPFLKRKKVLPPVERVQPNWFVRLTQLCRTGSFLCALDCRYANKYFAGRASGVKTHMTVYENAGENRSSEKVAALKKKRRKNPCSYIYTQYTMAKF